MIFILGGHKKCIKFEIHLPFTERFFAHFGTNDTSLSPNKKRYCIEALKNLEIICESRSLFIQPWQRFGELYEQCKAHRSLSSSCCTLKFLNSIWIILNNKI